jgi:hypothetical protein
MWRGESMSQTTGESMSQTACRVQPVQKKNQPRKETADRQRKQLTGKETNNTDHPRITLTWFLELPAGGILAKVYDTLEYLAPEQSYPQMMRLNF